MKEWIVVTKDKLDGHEVMIASEEPQKISNHFRTALKTLFLVIKFVNL